MNSGSRIQLQATYVSQIGHVLKIDVRFKPRAKDVSYIYRGYFYANRH
jgi:hypothetical protein